MAQDNENQDPQDDRQRQQGQSSEVTGVRRGETWPEGTEEMDDDDDRDDDWREPGSPNRRINIG